MKIPMMSLSLFFSLTSSVFIFMFLVNLWFLGYVTATALVENETDKLALLAVKSQITKIHLGFWPPRMIHHIFATGLKLYVAMSNKGSLI